MEGRWEIRVSVASLLLLVATATTSSMAPKCKVEDCPNFRAIRYYEELGCVRSDGSSDCCPKRFNCTNNESPRNVTECVYKGETYLEGEVIEEADSECMRCVCQEGYDGVTGTLKEPWCRRESCDYSHMWPDSELRGCAPVFSEDDKCCADTFHCPSSSDTLVRNPEAPKAEAGNNIWLLKRTISCISSGSEISDRLPVNKMSANLISTAFPQHIHQKIGYCEAWSRWIPWLLDSEQKANWMAVCLKHLVRFTVEGNTLLECITAGDEILWYHWEPEPKASTFE